MLVKDIGKGLFTLSNDLKLFNRLSQNAQVRIRTEYTWNQRGNQMKKVYEEVLNEI